MYQITLRLKNKRSLYKTTDTYQKAVLMTYYLEKLYQDEYETMGMENLDRPKVKVLKNKWRGNWDK